MTGLDKITAKLREDCDAECASILSDGRAAADKIMADAKAQADEASAQSAKSDAAAAEAVMLSAKSAAGMSSRQRVLREKGLIIEEAISAAKQNIRSLPDDKYFDAILAVLRRSAPVDGGTLYLSAHDLARLPDDFEKRLKDEYGGRITLDRNDGGRTADGFLPDCGDVGYNCSIDALASSMIDELRERAGGILFGDDK